MGFFGGGDDSPTRGEELAQQQLELNQQELEQKRQHLYRERLDIIKGQGGEQWSPDRTTGVSQPSDRRTIMGAGAGFVKAATQVLKK